MTNNNFADTANIKLLKTCKVTSDGKRYYNLYLQVNEGNPIAITLSFPEKDWKKKNLLLACAHLCNIKTTTLVREVGETKVTESEDF